ncbi:MAG: hypothetical protein KDB22_07965 [Planctomycetales bacterium]|nr:hypothetical protein [Planctomycetales bacterium]
MFYSPALQAHNWQSMGSREAGFCVVRPRHRIQLATIRFALAMVCLLLQGVATDKGVVAQTDDWEVMRVYVDDSASIIESIPDDYFPVNVEKLNQQLSAIATRRRTSELESPSLEEATYVASLDNDRLVSELSSWTLRGFQDRQVAQLDSISLAVNVARSTKPSQRQLIDHQSFGADGSIFLRYQQDDPTYWFGFSAKAQYEGKQRRFDLKLPAAPFSRILLALSPELELTSRTAAVERVVHPTEYLPKNWDSRESDTLFKNQAGMQWWVVHCSARRRVDLHVSDGEQMENQVFRHLVLRAQSDYVCSPKLIDVQCQFTVAGNNSNERVRLVVDPHLKVTQVSVDGQDSRWRYLPVKDDLERIVELQDIDTAKATYGILVQGMAPSSVADAIDLPSVSIRFGHVINGHSTIVASQGTMLHGVMANGFPVEFLQSQQTSTAPIDSRAALPDIRTADFVADAASSFSDPSAFSSADTDTWLVTWINSQPRMQVKIAELDRQPHVETLTRFEIHSEWISANCRVQVHADGREANHLSFQIGRDWLIDDVRVVTSNEASLWCTLQEKVEMTTGGILTEWDSGRPELQFEYEVIAHRPRRANQNRENLSGQSLVSLAGARQVDHYSIEPSDGFRVQVNSAMLRFQLQPQELPQWQQDLLPPRASRWIFAGNRGYVPAINLIAFSGTFVANITTKVNVEESQIETESTLKIQPISGAVDTIHVAVPPVVPAEVVEWHLLDDANRSVARLSPIIEERLVSGDVLVSLELPEATIETFAIRTSTRVSLSVEQKVINIPIPSVPRAAAGGSLVLLPKSLGIPTDLSGMQLLPASACCDDTSLMLASESSGKLAPDDFLVARLDEGESHVVSIPFASPSMRPRAWAWQEVLSHKVLDSGQQVHTCEWSVETNDAEPIRIELPPSWRIVTCQVNGQILDVFSFIGQTLELATNGAPQMHIMLKCHSQAAPLRSLGRVTIQRPKLATEVLFRQERVLISPSKVALSHMGGSAESLTPLERLTPSNLWRWLSPRNPSDPKPKQHAWHLIELEPKHATTGSAIPRVIWLVDRTALAVFGLAFALGCSAVLRWLSSRRPSLWWQSVIVAAVLVVIAPEYLLPPLQVIFLSCCCNALFRLISPLQRYRSRGLSQSQATRMAHVKAAINTILVWLFLSLSSPAFAQTDEGTSRATTSSQEDPKVYGVLIPVDRQNQVSGPYVYVPTELQQLLRQSEVQQDERRGIEVVSAVYTLRFRRAPLAGITRLYEVVLELIIRSNQAEDLLELPFDSSEVRLVGGQLDSVEIATDGRLVQDFARNSILFRSESAGTFKLALRFDEIPSTENGAYRSIRFAVPPLPNATLRIMSDGQQSFEVDSIGLTQKSMAGWQSRIGPVEYIDVRWPVAEELTTGQKMPRILSNETWIHASGPELISACSITVEASANQEIKMACDSAWRPVGTSWGDANLDSVNSQGLGTTDIYSLRLNANAEQERYSIQVLLVPKADHSASVLRIPFLSLQGANQSERVFTWTNDPNAKWHHENVDYWQVLTDDTESKWGDLLLSTNVRTRFRVPQGSVTALLRETQPEQTEATTAETTVHLGLASMVVNYRVQFDLSPTTPLEFEFQKEFAVSRVLLDAKPVKYRVGLGDPTKILTVHVNEQRTGKHSLELELERRIRLGTLTDFPQVLPIGRTVDRSRYRVVRSVGLNCQISSDVVTFDQPVSLLRSELLQHLESAVGEAVLNPALGNASVTLPAKFQLTRVQATNSPLTVLRYDRTDAGWTATFTARWTEVTKPIDMVCVQIPGDLRESINVGPVSWRIVPTGDSSRLSLCIVPPPPVNDIVSISLTFPLENSPSGKMVTIPELSVLAPEEATKIIALPKIIDQQRVQWLRVGRQKESEWKTHVTDELWEQYDFFELSDGMKQAAWKTEGITGAQPELRYEKLVVSAVESGNVSGVAQYWVEPNGSMSTEFLVAPECQVLGVELDGRSVDWRRDDNKISIVNRPNYLPLNVQLFLRWRISAAKGSIACPQVDFATDNHSRLVDVRVAGYSLGQSNKLQPVIDPLANKWAEVLNASVATLSTLSGPEMEDWLSIWHPTAMGINPEVSVAAPRSLSSDLSADEERYIPVSVLWESICNRLGASDDARHGIVTSISPNLFGYGSSQNRQSFDSSVVFYTSESELTILAETDQSAWLPKLMTSAMMLTLGGLGFFFVPRGLAYFQQVAAQHPWIYWLALALISAVVLPLALPSVYLFMVAIALMVVNYFDSRRRRY